MTDTACSSGCDNDDKVVWLSEAHLPKAQISVSQKGIETDPLMSSLEGCEAPGTYTVFLPDASISLSVHTLYL